jgi:hypothetical protein
VVGAYQLEPGLDYRIYMDRAQDWLAGDGFYLPRQLQGPYALLNGDALYPPISLLLFVPFTFLPAVVWWAIPVGIVSGTVLYHRPSLKAWALIGVCMVFWTEFALIVIKGNPMMWVAAFTALATVWPAFGPLVLVRPSAFPFALIGIRHRSWWVTFAVLVVVSVALLPMWHDWLRAVNDGEGEGLFMHHLLAWPTALIPVIAKLGSIRAVANERGTASGAPGSEPVHG